MKTCKHEGCHNYVFSKGLCKYHWRAEHGKPLQSYKNAPDGAKKRLKPKKKKPTGELKMFMEIYEDWKHEWVSELTGIPLPHSNEPLFINVFAHLLPKGLYPELRLCKVNIMRLTPREHHLLDFGHKSQRKKYAEKWGVSWDKVYLRIEALKENINNKNL